MAARERVLVEAMRVAGQRSGTVPHIYTVPQMRFIVRLLRYRGRILPWRDVMNQEPKATAGVTRCSAAGNESAGVHADRFRARRRRRVRSVVAGVRPSFLM